MRYPHYDYLLTEDRMLSSALREVLEAEAIKNTGKDRR